ncbi:killer cell lectin-like receptor subfamily I member 1 [Sciurus carolinensis]|uniref:killer cell lectin-like receptor subfamily I member 1 n=1 Tax=Sciurus carolinensis TaxID=30640 RepID=UPI001FB3F684|nr:killer cell lectin-like receptor subfamily I member 1 [Sciurus carolinensis]
MPQNKQNECILNKKEANYTEIKFFKCQQKRRIPKEKQGPIISSEEPVNYVQLKFIRTSHLQHKKCFVRGKKDPESAAWKVISGILGVLCMVLLTTVGVLLSNLLSRREKQNKTISTLSSKNNECSCDLSFHNWIGFGNSYYHFFNEAKTWPESRTACMELNSHLLRIETQEELDVLSTFGMVGWLGLKMNETDGSWLWEDGTDVKKSLIPLMGKENQNCAYIRGKYTYSENCSCRNIYICEFNT